MKKGFRGMAALVRKNGWLSLSAAFATMITVVLEYAIPLVMSETADVVLTDNPSALPAWLTAPLAALGGRVFLRRHYWLIALGIVAINLVSGAFSYVKERNIAVAGENIAKGLREKLYHHLSHLPFGFHVRAETGDLVQRCTSDVDTVRRFLSVQLLEGFRAIVMAVIALVVLFNRNAEIAVYSLMLIPIMFLASFLFFKRISKDFLLSDASEGKMSAVLQENLTGVRVVRAFGTQQQEVEKFDMASRDFQKKTYKMYKSMCVYWGSADALTMLQIMITLLVCVWKAVAGEITIGTLIVFTSYITMLVYPIRQLGRIISDAGKSVVALGRIHEILEKSAEEPEEGALRPPLNGDIVFDHVSFQYEEGNPVLKELCLTIPAGKTVAVLGNTGSGKSTLALLLQRLYEPLSGTITIGGVDIQRIDRKYLRSRVGLMLQEPFLYGRTMMGNLAIAASDATEDHVKRISRMTAADGFINEFEKGYDTLIGERGVTLSGGQRQRVAIARTLLKDNDILIFDDSLSAVDMQTDRRIREQLRQTRSRITTLVISHRISTLCESDLILVLDGGKLSGQGTHEELIMKDGLYQQIFAIQSTLEDDLQRSRQAVEKEEF